MTLIVPRCSPSRSQVGGIAVSRAESLQTGDQGPPGLHFIRHQDVPSLRRAPWYLRFYTTIVLFVLRDDVANATPEKVSCGVYSMPFLFRQEPGQLMTGVSGHGAEMTELRDDSKASPGVGIVIR
jgi:hypothetical protein